MFEGKLSEKMEGKVTGSEKRKYMMDYSSPVGHIGGPGPSFLSEVEETVYTADFNGEEKKFTLDPHVPLKEGMTVTVLKYERWWILPDYYRLLMKNSKVNFTS